MKKIVLFLYVFYLLAPANLAAMDTVPKKKKHGRPPVPAMAKNDKNQNLKEVREYLRQNNDDDYFFFEHQCGSQCCDWNEVIDKAVPYSPAIVYSLFCMGMKSCPQETCLCSLLLFFGGTTCYYCNYIAQNEDYEENNTKIYKED